MKKNDKKVLNEDIKKMLYRANYSINETPKYKAIIEDESEFDTLPMEVMSTLDGQPMPNSAGSDAFLEEVDDNVDDNAGELPGAQEISPTDPVAAPSNALTPDNEPAGPTPEMDGENDPEMPPEGEEDGEEDVTVDDKIEAENEVEVEPEKNVDEIQNEIIKHNIAAMQSINDKLKGLDQFVNTLTTQLDTLNTKVEEVEEPTNVEKLVAQKDVSYPYYFGLNDYWNGGVFDAQNNQQGNGEMPTDENGIRELPDGTYIADFDDLPISNDNNIEDTFNKIT